MTMGKDADWCAVPGERSPKCAKCIIGITKFLQYARLGRRVKPVIAWGSLARRDTNDGSRCRGTLTANGGVRVIRPVSAGTVLPSLPRRGSSCKQGR